MSQAAHYFGLRHQKTSRLSPGSLHAFGPTPQKPAIMHEPLGCGLVTARVDRIRRLALNLFCHMVDFCISDQYSPPQALSNRNLSISPTGVSPSGDKLQTLPFPCVFKEVNMNRFHVLSAVAAAILALPARATSTYTISASLPATQLETNTPGAITFADSSTFQNYDGTVLTSQGTISGGWYNLFISTNPGTGFPGDGGISNWISAWSPRTITITFNGYADYFGFLWGSMDSTNTIAFYNGSGKIASYSGAYMEANFSNVCNWPCPASFVNFSADDSGSNFNRIVLSDPFLNFEVDNFAMIGASPVPGPEPKTSEMMLVGLGVLGLFAGCRKLRVT
jgi:hypothetical protein